MDNHLLLMQSIMARNIENFKKYLMADDTSINHINMCKGPLHLACEMNCEEIVDILLADQRLNYGQYFKEQSKTPLHIACWKGSLSIVKKFLAINPEWINLLNYQGESPLYLTVEQNN